MQKYCYYCLSQLSGHTVCPHCGRDSAIAEQKEKYYLKPGTVLQSRYLVGNCIGSGGFGITYAGMDLFLERKVAIKEYFPSDCVTRKQDDREIIFYTEELRQIFEDGKESFIKEAKNLARLGDIQGVVKIYDWIQEMGTSYIVMEFLEGRTVKTAMKERKKPFSWNETRFLLLYLLNALRYVHNAGLVHRDITPDNIFILNNGEIKLIDFGAARTTVTDRTQSFTVMLKPGFAPEEQYSAKGKQGPWTDVYALAATAYYMLTGSVPEDAISRFMEDRVVLPSKMNISIPAEDEKVLMKALSLHYADRYQNADELRSALLRSPRGAVREERIPRTGKDAGYEPLREAGRRPGDPFGSHRPGEKNHGMAVSGPRDPERRGRYEKPGNEPEARREISSGTWKAEVSGGAYAGTAGKMSSRVLQPLDIPLDQLLQQKKRMNEPLNERYEDPQREAVSQRKDPSYKTGLLIGLGITAVLLAAALLIVWIL